MATPTTRLSPSYDPPSPSSDLASPSPSYGLYSPSRSPPIPGCCNTSSPSYNPPTSPSPSSDPPSPSYSPPSPSYNTPSPCYDPASPSPSSDPLSASSEPLSPSPSYGPPSPSYNTPSPVCYDTPSPSYNSSSPSSEPFIPSPSYGPPSPSYNTLSPSYDPASPISNRPSPSYYPPNPHHNYPHQNPSYNSPSLNYDPASPSYDPPSPGGSKTPSSSYDAASPGYDLANPSPSYDSSSPSYNTPNPGCYNAPSLGCCDTPSPSYDPPSPSCYDTPSPSHHPASPIPSSDPTSCNLNSPRIPSYNEPNPGYYDPPSQGYDPPSPGCYNTPSPSYDEPSPCFYYPSSSSYDSSSPSYDPSNPSYKLLSPSCQEAPSSGYEIEEQGEERKIGQEKEREKRKIDLPEVHMIKRKTAEEIRVKNENIVLVRRRETEVERSIHNKKVWRERETEEELKIRKENKLNEMDRETDEERCMLKEREKETSWGRKENEKKERKEQESSERMKIKNEESGSDDDIPLAKRKKMSNKRKAALKTGESIYRKEEPVEESDDDIPIAKRQKIAKNKKAAMKTEVATKKLTRKEKKVAAKILSRKQKNVATKKLRKEKKVIISDRRSIFNGKGKILRILDSNYGLAIVLGFGRLSKVLFDIDDVWIDTGDAHECVDYGTTLYDLMQEGDLVYLHAVFIDNPPTSSTDQLEYMATGVATTKNMEALLKMKLPFHSSLEEVSQDKIKNFHQVAKVALATQDDTSSFREVMVKSMQNNEIRDESGILHKRNETISHVDFFCFHCKCDHNNGKRRWKAHKQHVLTCQSLKCLEVGKQRFQRMKLVQTSRQTRKETLKFITLQNKLCKASRNEEVLQAKEFYRLILQHSAGKSNLNIIHCFHCQYEGESMSHFTSKKHQDHVKNCGTKILDCPENPETTSSVDKLISWREIVYIPKASVSSSYHRYFCFHCKEPFSDKRHIQGVNHTLHMANQRCDRTCKFVSRRRKGVMWCFICDVKFECTRKTWWSYRAHLLDFCHINNLLDLVGKTVHTD